METEMLSTHIDYEKQHSKLETLQQPRLVYMRQSTFSHTYTPSVVNSFLLGLSHHPWVPQTSGHDSIKPTR
jgi:hypothetical protein